MDLEALKQKALQSLRQKQQLKQQESSSDSISSKREEGEVSDSPEKIQNKRFFQQKNIGLKRVKQSSTTFHSKQQQKTVTNYFWHKKSRPELLASLDSLLQVVREAEGTEHSLRQRWLECRQVRRSAQKQLESLQSYLSSPYTLHAVKQQSERADRLFTHLIMRDSSLLWFKEKFKMHPAYAAFVTHQDTASFQDSSFDPKIPFCLEEACFEQCSCLQDKDPAIDTIDLSSLSFNHFNLIFRDL